MSPIDEHTTPLLDAEDPVALTNTIRAVFPDVRAAYVEPITEPVDDDGSFEAYVHLEVLRPNQSPLELVALLTIDGDEDAADLAYRALCEVYDLDPEGRYGVADLASLCAQELVACLLENPREVTVAMAEQLLNLLHHHAETVRFFGGRYELAGHGTAVIERAPPYLITNPAINETLH